MTMLQIDRDAARPFMDRYLDGSSFCDDRNDLATAFTAHREQATAELVEVLRFYADPDNYECGPGDVIMSDYEVMANCGERARLALTKATTNE